MSQTNFENNSFPVIEDQVSLTNGDHRCNVLWNVSDVTGTVTLQFRENSVPVTDVKVPPFSAIDVKGVYKVTITSGEFHKA